MKVELEVDKEVKEKGKEVLKAIGMSFFSLCGSVLMAYALAKAVIGISKIYELELISNLQFIEVLGFILIIRLATIKIVSIRKLKTVEKETFLDSVKSLSLNLVMVLLSYLLASVCHILFM